MSQEERHGTRDMTYSAWHRRLSTGRFVGIERAQLLAMIDLDACPYVEYDDQTKEPLALIEVAEDVKQKWKVGTVTRNLAKKAGIPAFVVLYQKSEAPNPADPAYQDIKSFRIRQVYPRNISKWTTMNPKTYAQSLLDIRRWSAKKLDKELFAEKQMEAAS